MYDWFSVREEQVTDGDAGHPWLALVARNHDNEVVFRSSPTGYEHDTRPIDAVELMKTAQSEVEAWVVENNPRATLLWNVAVLSLTFWVESWDPVLTNHQLVAKVEGDTRQVIDSRWRCEVYEDDDAVSALRALAERAFPGVPLTNA